MRQLFELLRTVAATASTVLITGETGTGKELAARAIHDASPRRSQRFVAINCSAIPETLLEAELFGHVRGAFTGAVANRQGRLEQAHRGTLFLDEVGHDEPGAAVEAAARAAVARVRTRRRFANGESRRPRHRGDELRPQKMVDEGAFREDLYYRLNVIPVRVPPLRERRAGHPAARTALPRSARQGSDAAARPRHARAGRAAGADGVRLAGQRAAARERDGADVRAVAGPGADRRRGPARGDPAACARRCEPADFDPSRRRASSSIAAGREFRAHADSARARTDRRQQAVRPPSFCT